MGNHQYYRGANLAGTVRSFGRKVYSRDGEVLVLFLKTDIEHAGPIYLLRN